ncbi:ABC transporter permease [Hyphomicrobium facile]|uniref:Putative spermidine/putrescine transport system permease protein n=1 Tax=Hyphomicrobium facile TaxID=51670 RepID=A0A1I7NDV0_9HYPH|nr:ABC transporter permease [Hyphomicrobium facile]SFV32811.1 putative spermidine/putrescine transport system permease protein [Hyphomicrobium facile]
MVNATVPSPMQVKSNAQAGILKFSSWGFVAFIVIYLLTPIIVTLLMSFSDASALRFPIREWSTKWYGDFFASPQWTDALLNSLMIAVGTTVISTTCGVVAAWAFEKYEFRFKPLLYLLVMLPLFMPGVVLGLGVAMAMGSADILGYQLYGSRLIVMLAHSLWAIPLVFMLMETTFRTVDHRIVEASYDLGGRPFQTFFEIVLPSVSTGIVSSALFAFVISLNEFVMALFLTTRDTQTLPVLMWLSLRSAGTPRLAVASVVLACTVIISLAIIMVWHSRQLRKAQA